MQIPKIENDIYLLEDAVYQHKTHACPEIWKDNNVSLPHF